MATKVQIKRAEFHEELLALQQLAHRDIAFFKRQQWRFCNYTLTVYAALIAFVKLLPTPPPYHCIVPVITVLLAFLTGAFAYWLIWDTGKAIQRGRYRMTNIKGKWHKITLKAWDHLNGYEGPPVESDDKVKVTVFLHAVIILGFVITSLLLCLISECNPGT